MNDALIYDWNQVAPVPAPSRVMLCDETLRDGLQSPSVRAPSIAQKIRILHFLDQIGIDTRRGVDAKVVTAVLHTQPIECRIHGHDRETSNLWDHRPRSNSDCRRSALRCPPRLPEQLVQPLD